MSVKKTPFFCRVSLLIFSAFTALKFKNHDIFEVPIKFSVKNCTRLLLLSSIWPRYDVLKLGSAVVMLLEINRLCMNGSDTYRDR